MQHEAWDNRFESDLRKYAYFVKKNVAWQYRASGGGQG